MVILLNVDRLASFSLVFIPLRTAVKRSACLATSKGVKRFQGQTVTFDEVLDQVRELLQQRGRVTYRSLKLRYQLDEELLAGVTAELIKAERVAAEEDGDVLVWIGKERGQEPEKRRSGERTNNGF